MILINCHASPYSRERAYVKSSFNYFTHLHQQIVLLLGLNLALNCHSVFSP